MITTVTISGIHCDACLKLIQRRLAKIPGVQDLTVEKTGKTTITGERKTTSSEIQDALIGTDYKIVTE